MCVFKYTVVFQRLVYTKASMHSKKHILYIYLFTTSNNSIRRAVTRGRTEHFSVMHGPCCHLATQNVYNLSPARSVHVWPRPIATSWSTLCAFNNWNNMRTAARLQIMPKCVALTASYWKVHVHNIDKSGSAVVSCSECHWSDPANHVTCDVPIHVSVAKHLLWAFSACEYCMQRANRSQATRDLGWSWTPITCPRPQSHPWDFHKNTEKCMGILRLPNTTATNPNLLIALNKNLQIWTPYQNVFGPTPYGKRLRRPSQPTPMITTTIIFRALSPG